MSNSVYPNPFSWGEVEEKSLTSFYTKRQASYKTPAKETYNGNAHEAFYDNAEAPTPQLAQVDGYKSEKEITENTESDTKEEEVKE